MPRIRASFDGLDAVLQAVGDLEPKVIRPAVRRGVEDATRLLLWAARRHLRATGARRTGALYRSLGRRVIAYRSGNRKVVGIVGPRVDTRDRLTKAGRVRKGKTFSSVAPGKGKVKTVVPARYAHLVEFGTRTARPKPFLRPAYEETRAAAIAAIKARVRAAVRGAAAGRGVR